MMYRRNAAVTPRRETQANVAEGGFLAAIRGAVASMFGADVWDAAWRENRRIERLAKRYRLSVRYANAGLNGARAVERRMRQIAAGQITHANGLVA